MKNLTIGKRIAGTSGALIALAALLGIVSLFSLSRISNYGRQISDVSLPMMRDLQKATVAAKEQKIAMLTHIASASPQQMANAETMISLREAEFQESLAKLAADTSDVSLRQLVEEWKAGHQQLLSVWSKILPFSRSGKNDVAFRIWIEQGLPAANATAQATARLDEAINSESSQNSKASLASADGARFWCWFLLIMSVLTGSLLSFFVIKSISRTLNAAVFELGQGADQVASASSEIAASSQSLAQGTSEQAASLEETSASSEEMTSMTRKNADNSQQCAQLMLQVDSRVIAANQTLGQMVNSMNEINSSSDKISKIIKVIDEIAFQTNILALNAAVEAARAGEAGMGFAVVADEVRTLAQRSAQAAKDTAALIEESISRSNEGRAKLTQVSDAISTITESTNQVKTLVDEVNLGSQEQARGVEQIAKAIAQIEKVTQQAASSSEETASASEELTAQVGAIRTIIGQLQSLVDIAHPAVAKSSVRSSSVTKRAKKPVSMARSLTALKAATSNKAPLRKTESIPQHSYAGAGKPDRNPIPMDDDFKEF